MKLSLITLPAGYIILCSATVVLAQAPDSISFQGYVTDTGGSPLDTSGVDIVFKLYKGNTAVWTETQTGVPVNNGVFNVYLGSVEPIDTVAFDRSVDLGIKVGDDLETVPRTKLASAPYALSLRALRVQPATTGSLASPNLIGGHDANSVSSGVTGATIGGGGVANSPNMVSDDFGTVSGGLSNSAGRSATVGGGFQNSATGDNATVGGGRGNVADTVETTVGGGQGNTAGGINATVSGGSGNSALAGHSSVGGGGQNDATANYTTVAGGQLNDATDAHATVGGGLNNTADGQYTTVAGGKDNTASNFTATVSGGVNNTAGQNYATVSGGQGNSVTSSNATIGGGANNVASGGSATVGGGGSNAAVATSATIAGGSSNTASGFFSAIPGGQKNSTAGYTSFAAGFNAKSNNDGSFVWSDRSKTLTADSLYTTADNQFLIRAKGGVGIGNNAPLSAFHLSHGNLSLSSSVIFGEELIVEAGDAVLGLYSNDTGSWGSALVLGHMSGGSLTNKWSIVRETSGAGNDLHFKFGSNSNYASNTTKVEFRDTGGVHITGTLSKGGGAFMIDHPLDPTNKFLFHSFVESPDMKNIYDGIIALDENGEATVEMPAYFEALNREFRYQLTCIGGFANVYIADELENNTFKIAGGTPGMKVSWMLTGIRKDAFAEQNRIQVEVDKDESERGTYLHPEAFGVTQ